MPWLKVDDMLLVTCLKVRHSMVKHCSSPTLTSRFDAGNYAVERSPVGFQIVFKAPVMSWPVKLQVASPQFDGGTSCLVINGGYEWWSLMIKLVNSG